MNSAPLLTGRSGLKQRRVEFQHNLLWTTAAVHIVEDQTENGDFRKNGQKKKHSTSSRCWSSTEYFLVRNIFWWGGEWHISRFGRRRLSHCGAAMPLFEYLPALIYLCLQTDTVSWFHRQQCSALKQVAWLNNYNSCQTGEAYRRACVLRHSTYNSPEHDA